MSDRVIGNVFGGRRVNDLQVFGQVVDLFVTPELEELARRDEIGLGSLQASDVLRVLIALPYMLPVSAHTLDPLDLLVLERVPGAVRWCDDGMVVREARAPYRLDGIVKWAGDLESLQLTTLLRTHAPCLVICPPNLLAEARRTTGEHLGLATCGDDEDELVRIHRVPDGRWLKPSWQRWLVAEAAYDATLGSQQITI